MSFELDKIENVDIYSFESVENMRDFVSKNNLIEYELKSESETDNLQRKYNTRSRPNSDQCRLDVNLSCYLNKLDCDHTLLDPAGEDLNLISFRSSKRHTRSQTGRVSLPECGKIYCRLGCICEKSNHGKNKNSGKHCGRFECMFECNCARKLRSSTRAKNEPDKKKESSSGSVCSRSSSNSSTSLRKSKRCRTKVNYSSYSKTGSCSDASAESASKPTAPKFRPFSQTMTINHTQILKLEILSKNFDTIKDTILDFLKKIFAQLNLFEWKELCFSYDKIVNVCVKKNPLVARVTKYKTKDAIKIAELDAICSKFPMVCIYLFRFKKNSANKENKAPQPKSMSKVLPRLLCRKANKLPKSETKKIFTNLESLLEQLPKKFDKISDAMRNYRDYEKIKLFKEEKEFLSKNNSKALYDPFSDQSLVIDCYKKVDSRSLVDTVAETLNDMIGVVCTHKENLENKSEIFSANFIRTEMPKRRPKVIILKRNMHKNNAVPLTQEKTFVKILNTNEGNRVSIVNKLVDDKPVFKVNFDQPISTLATIKQSLQINSVDNKKRKRKQDLSFLSTKIIQINRVEAPINESKNNTPIIVSRTLFSKKFKSNDQIFTPTNFVKQEPEIIFSDSINQSPTYLSLYNESSINVDSMEESSENSFNNENRASPFSMLKFDTLPSSSNYNSDSCRKLSISSNNSSFKTNKNFEDELMDSDVENDDDYFSKSSDSTKSSGLKNASLNLHSVRERQRRLRLKNLLNKLKFALYDIDENTSSVKINNSNFKHSKQATLAEAVDHIKKMEIQGEKLEHEFENLKSQNLILKKRLEYLKAQMI